MSTPFEIPEWLVREPEPSSLPPVDDHRVEGLVNNFIAGKQDALFTAPDAYYRLQDGEAVDGAPAIAQRLEDLRSATLEQARDDGERSALEPRLDAHIDDAMDGIGRHVDAQRRVFQRNTLGTRQALIQRAAALEHDNDDKIAGLAEAHAGAAQELARLDGVDPDSPEAATIGAAARSQILRTAIDQRIANARSQQAIDFYDKMKALLTSDDRRTLELPIGAASDDAATDAWLARESIQDGAPLVERAGLDDGLSDMQRLILRAKIDARDSAAESSRVATVKGLDDQLAAAEGASAGDKAQGKGLLGVSNIAIKELIRQNGNNPTRKAQLEEWQKGDARMRAEPAMSIAAEYLRLFFDRFGHSWVNAAAAYKSGEGELRPFLRGQASKLDNEAKEGGLAKGYLSIVFDGNPQRYDSYR